MKLTFPLLFLASGLAVAETSEAPVEQVKHLLRAAIEESKKNHDYGTQILIGRLNSLEGRGAVYMSGPGPRRTEPSEYGLTANIDEIEILSRLPQIQAECRRLRPKLRAEMETQDALLAAKIRKGVTDAFKQALEAKSAKDLEAPKAAMEKLWIEGRTHGEEKTWEASEGAQFYGPSLLQYLQDVLSSDGRPSHRQWDNLRGSWHSTTGYMPRSEYLERFAQFLRNNQLPKHYDANNAFHEKLLQLLKGISSPAAIPKALEQLDELSRFDSYEATTSGSPVRETKEILNEYLRLHLDLTQGRATKINFGTTPLVIPQILPAFLRKEPPPEPLTSNRADIGHELIRLRNQLVLLALPRTLGLAQQARTEETIPSYLERIASQARQNADWKLLLRILEMKQTLHVGMAPETVDTISALRSFISGLDQEQAQDYVTATQSFQAVLQSGTQVPPAELVGGHLGRLSAKHTQEFQQAMRRPETPPRDPNIDNYSISYLIHQQAMQPPKPALPQIESILTVPAKADVK
jgi:hypothetical protein